MTQVLARIVLVAVLFTGSAVSGQTQSVTYKGTQFGITEKAFIQRRNNEGFVCGFPFDKVGRECVSEVATYADEKVSTHARFIKDKLVSVVMIFRNDGDISSQILSDISIPDKIEEQHGKPNEEMWPSETNGIRTWKKVWRKNDGTSVMYIRSLSVAGDVDVNMRMIALSAKDADRIHIDAKKAIKPDM